MTALFALGARSAPILAASSRSNRSSAAATLALRPKGGLNLVLGKAVDLDGGEVRELWGLL
jgi:hypothetical protein